MTNRILVAILIGVSVLCFFTACLTAVVVFSPLRSQIARAFDRDMSQNVQPFDERGAPEPDSEPGDLPFLQESSPEEGIQVAGVMPGSPAEEAGVEQGDVLLEVDDQPVNTLMDLFTVLSERESGDEVELLVQRGDEQITLNATLDETSSSQQRGGLMNPMALGIIPGGGFGFGNMPEGFMEGTAAGIRIDEVVADSPAEEAGLAVGDVIVEAEGEPVRSPRDLTQRIADQQPGDEITLTVQNEDGESREVTVTLGENPSPEKQGLAWLGVAISPALGNLDQIMPMPNMPSVPKGEQMPMDPGSMMLPLLPEGYKAGAFIAEVIADSPAEEAGLQAGSLILAVNGEKLESADDLSEMIAALEPGDEVTLTISEPAGSADGLSEPQASEVVVVLGENEDQAGAAYLGIRYGFFDTTQFERRQEKTPEPGTWLPQLVPAG